MRNLALVIHSLEGGGAQRVLTSLANRWASQGDRIRLITLERKERDAYPLDSAVERIGLNVTGDSPNLRQALQRNRNRVARLREALRDFHADSVVSFVDQTNILALFAARPLGLPVIIAERTDPRHHRLGVCWTVARRVTYPWCAAAVVQTETIGVWMQRATRGKPIYVIPNPAPVVENLEGDLRRRRQARTRVVASLGRLSPVKGLDVLIEAFAEVCSAHPDWKLRIYGEGSEGPRLRTLADTLAPGRVEWAGWSAEPTESLRRCDVFVLASRYEGFPNALLEAMASGLAVISTDCDSGPRDIIRPEVDGLLVPVGDSGAMAVALRRCMGDAALRERLGHNASRVADRFNAEHLYVLWDQVLGATRQGAAGR